jgi:molecular chaperone GrpE
VNTAPPDLSALPDTSIAAVLADFQKWLAGATAPIPVRPTEEAPTKTQRVDLHTLVANFVALRQEVNLQTRATRAQQEQNVETLRQLEQALAAVEKAQAAADEVQFERLRPLLKTLIDLHEALSLAGREMQRTQDTVVGLLEQLLVGPQAPVDGGKVERPIETPGSTPEMSHEQAPPRSWWGRLFGTAAGSAAQRAEAARAARRREHEERESQARAGCERLRQVLAALVTGYTMSLQRIERALRQHGLSPIPTVGEIFDPERMEVVEAATGTGRPPGEVLEEVRRGFLFNGRVFRYAQVRVAKS